MWDNFLSVSYVKQLNADGGYVLYTESVQMLAFGCYFLYSFKQQVLFEDDKYEERGVNGFGWTDVWRVWRLGNGWCCRQSR